MDSTLTPQTNDSREETDQPYGPEWEKALMRLDKKTLVIIIRRVCLERDKAEGKQ